MANIAQNLSKILTARYGHEVRQSIHDSIRDCYQAMSGRFLTVPRGPYNAETEYELMDLVTDDGKIYLYINDTPSAGINLVNTEYWASLYLSADPSIRGGDIMPGTIESTRFSSVLQQNVVKNVVTEYYSSTSTDNPTGGSWSINAPEWEPGRYVWSRIKIITISDDVMYSPSSAGVNISGAAGKEIQDVKTQYYFSTSDISPTGGNWSDDYIPSIPEPFYVWSRFIFTFTDTSITETSAMLVRGIPGVQGPSGGTGLRGYTGSRGYSGSVGPIGLTGSTGAQGLTGYAGSQGIKGDTGYTGSRGNTGLLGYTGSHGLQGGTGYTGSFGPIGYTGSQGVGYTGSQGPQGVQGEVGPAGLQGYQGIEGPIGEAGRGIASQIAEYALHTSGITPPASGWSNTPAAEQGKFLWTRITATYTDESTFVYYAIAYQGMD